MLNDQVNHARDPLDWIKNSSELVKKFNDRSKEKDKEFETCGSRFRNLATLKNKFSKINEHYKNKITYDKLNKLNLNHTVQDDISTIYDWRDVDVRTVEEIDLIISLHDEEVDKLVEKGLVNGNYSIHQLVMDEIHLAQHHAIDETVNNHTYTPFELTTSSIILSKIITNLHLEDSKTINEGFPLEGTEFHDLTQLSSSGRADPVNDGYVRLESFSELELAIKREPTNETLKVWRNLFLNNVITPRAMDFSLCYLSLLMRYVIQKSVTPTFLRMAFLVNKLSDPATFPWRKGKDFTSGNRMTNKAKKAPIILGGYFGDLMKREVDYYAGMYSDLVSQSDLATHDIEILNAGYFSSILKFKKIKDIIFKIISDGRTVTTLVNTTEARPTDLSIKKGVNFVFGFDDIVKDVEQFTLGKKIIRKVRSRNYGVDDTWKMMLDAVTALHASSSSVFIWTDLAIAAIKSQYSKVATAFIPPEIKSQVADNGFVLDYFKTKGSLILNKIESYFQGIRYDGDLESAFLRNLTSNSSGEVPQDVIDVIRDSPPEIKNLAASKIGVVALVPGLLNNIDLYTQACQAPYRALFRQQILRRSRIVIAVNIAQQVVFNLGNVVGKIIASKGQAFATGKTSGGAHDAKLQLYSTGTPNQYTNYLDVSGFDASDPEEFQRWIRTMILKAFEDHDADGYFCGVPQLWDTMTKKTEGVGFTNEMVKVNQYYHLFEIATRQSSYPRIKDKRNISLANSTLQSGAFDTTFQATVVTAGLGDVVKDEFMTNNVHATGSGDDFIMRYSINNKADEIIHDISQQMNSVMSEQLKRIGFIGEPNYSSLFGEFLQIGAFAGCVVSYNHRLSLFTAERVEFKHPLVNAGAMYSIANEYFGRIHYPDEFVRFLYRYTYVLSFIQVDASKDTQLRKTKYVHEDRFKKKHVIQKYFRRIPQFALYIKYNIPFPRNYSEKGMIPASSVLSYGSDSKYLELCSHVFGFKSINDELFDEMTQDAAMKNLIIKARQRYEQNGYQFGFYEYLKTEFNKGTIFNSVFSRIQRETVEYIDGKNTMIYSLMPFDLTLHDISFSDDEVDSIVTLSENMNDLYGREKISKSEMAYNLLKTKNINVPESLTLARENREKLFGVYKSKLVNDSYWSKLDLKISKFYNNNSNKTFKQLITHWAYMFDIVINLSEDKVEMEDETRFLSMVPVTPPSMFSYDAKAFMSRFGIDASSHGKKLSILDRATGYDYLKSNVNAWKRIISEIISQSNSLIEMGENVNLTAQAIGLSVMEASVLRDLVLNGSDTPSGLIHIEVNARKQYWVSESALSHLKRMTNILNQNVILRYPYINRTVEAISSAINSFMSSYIGAHKIDVTIPTHFISYCQKSKKSAL